MGGLRVSVLFLRILRRLRSVGYEKSTAVYIDCARVCNINIYLVYRSKYMHLVLAIGACLLGEPATGGAAGGGGGSKAWREGV